ncbi:KRAB-A domain-containing protein 2-like [Palaemon carinicauda]|uniref:KRAB-A domain-containing protein 2-like n=1 Tax=Palaemon carinicauda TaxID=392227 RepID=UPI0035B64509
MFETIKRAHIATGHGGRDKMVKELSKYANITRDIRELFKSLCVQSCAKGKYKWIMVYQDHLTKYCILCPSTSKSAAEVAFQLMDIFSMFGSPQILQSDNGSEFTALVISELKLLWPDLLIVHGKPRHPQSQGSVERLNCDIKDMLISWLGDNDITDWPMGLSFSSDSTRPDESPEFTNPPDDSPECSAPPNDSPEDFAQPDGSSESSAPPNDSPEDFAQPDDSAEGSGYPVSPTCGQNPQGRLHQLQEDIALQRSTALAGQLAQAERMVKRSRLEHFPGDPEDNMTIPIPLVDRGKGDPRNVAGVILDRN